MTSAQGHDVILLLTGLIVLGTVYGIIFAVILCKIHNRLGEIACDTLEIAPHTSESAETLAQISDATTDLVTLLNTLPVADTREE